MLRVTIKLTHFEKNVVQAVIETHEQTDTGVMVKAFEDFMAHVDIASEGFSRLHNHIAPLSDEVKQSILMYLKGYRDALRKEEKTFLWTGDN